jgi:flavorubredoxin
MNKQLTEETYWVCECHDVDDMHEHVGVHLIEDNGDFILIDSGSFHDREAIKAQIEAVSDGRGLDAIILSHSDYPHAGNVSEFRDEWEDVMLIASCGSPDIQGLSDAVRCHIGSSMDILGRTFSFIDPPLADRSHTAWIYDHTDRILYTADGFGNYHGDGECTYTSADFPDGTPEEEIYKYHRDNLVWLRYVDPERLRLALESVFSEYAIDWIAPVHGNPIAGDDVDEYMTRLIASAGRISDEYEVPEISQS